MYLAEALAERAEAQRRFTQITQRLNNLAQVQDGETPEEDPKALLKEATELLKHIEELVRRINKTNIETKFDKRNTLADVLVHRDTLNKTRQVYTQLADAASQRPDRYSHSEIKYVATVKVKELRAEADKAAKEFRLLDTKIQQLNWLTKLAD